MRKRTFIFFVSFMLLSAGSLFSQVTVVKSTEIQIIEGVTCYIHEVKPGQTLYSISKAYNVSIDKIKAENHLESNALQAGIKLRIPTDDNELNGDNVLLTNAGTMELTDYVVVNGESLYSIAAKYKTTVDNLKKLNPGITDNISVGQVIKVPVEKHKVVEKIPRVHVVSSGETLYSIAKQYLMTLNELKVLNPGLKESISVGQKIVVGYEGDQSTAVQKDTVCDCSHPKKLNEYNVALLIPLYLDRASFKTFDKENKDDNEWYNHVSLSYVQFYEGLKFALDTLKAEGLNINLYVFDLDETEAKFSKVMSNPEMKKMHLIIGPFQEKYLDTISRFSYANKIPMVNCFLSSGFELSEMNPYFFNPITTVEYQMKGLADFYKAERSDANLIVAYMASGVEEKAAHSLDSSLKANQFGSWKMVNLTETGLRGVSSNLVGGKRENIVVMLISGEMYVENTIRSMSEFKENFNISMYGLPSWLNYDLLDLEFLEFQHTHFFSSSFVDFEKESVRRFTRKYQRVYKGDPDRQAYVGYDIGLYFLSALNTYGTSFPNCLDKHSPALLSTQLDFIFSKADGYRNTYISIYRMEDFQLWRVK